MPRQFETCEILYVVISIQSYIPIVLRKFKVLCLQNHAIYLMNPLLRFLEYNSNTYRTMMITVPVKTVMLLIFSRGSIRKAYRYKRNQKV